MITAIVNRQNKTATITYPEFAKMKPVVIKVNSFEEAASILRIREIKFISNEIRSFIKMRSFAYNQTNTWTTERTRAINHLQFVVDTYSEGSTYRLAKHVANSRVSFSALMPVKESPAKTHFDNHIVPIIQYCTEIYSNSIKK